MHPEDTPATLAPWARTATFWSGGALFLAGFTMSAWSLTMFMLMLGVPHEAAWTLFLCLDAGAIVGVVMWVGGTGSISDYGRSTARTLFLLSILGNGLERMLAFGTPAGQSSPTNAEATLAQFVLLLRRLFNWEDPLAAGALWFVLAVSIGVGIVFPTLAYRMGHAIILSRQAAASTGRKKAGKLSSFLARWFENLLLVSTGDAAIVPNETTREGKRASSTPVPTRKAPSVPDSVPPPPARPRPYVHDSTDYEVGSPEWHDRVSRLPGETKSEKLEFWLTREWAEGRSPKLSTAERVVDGKRLGSNVKAKLALQGIHPPGEGAAETEPAELQELATAS